MGHWLVLALTQFRFAGLFTVCICSGQRQSGLPFGKFSRDGLLRVFRWRYSDRIRPLPQTLRVVSLCGVRIIDLDQSSSFAQNLYGLIILDALYMYLDLSSLSKSKSERTRHGLVRFSVDHRVQNTVFAMYLAGEVNASAAKAICVPITILRILQVIRTKLQYTKRPTHQT